MECLYMLRVAAQCRSNNKGQLPYGCLKGYVRSNVGQRKQNLTYLFSYVVNLLSTLPHRDNNSLNSDPTTCREVS